MSSQPLDQKEQERIKIRVEEVQPPEPVVELKAFPDLGDDMEVLEFIGEGGMGYVYRVLDKRLNKHFAIKLLKADLASDNLKQQRFQKEVDSAVNLDHPNLVTVYHHATAVDGTPFMVMDFVDGQSMAEMLAQEVLIHPHRAGMLFLQICDGVAHAHLNGVVHLDLKPSNVLVANGENAEIAKVSDFGIAQVMTDESSQISQTEEIIGSLPYMSPEHCKGEDLDYRSDVYSLGCLMYEVLTGKPPFVGENPVKTIMKHIQEKPKRLKTRLTRLDIPEGLERIVLHCLEKNPNHRYQNTEELIKDLELVRDGLDPLIALQQEQIHKQEEKDQTTAHVKIACFAGFVLLCMYFVHLSQYDTLLQLGLLLSSIMPMGILLGLVALQITVSDALKRVALRIKDSKQVRPGDHWLSLALISSSSFLACLFVVILAQVLYYNHIFLDSLLATEPGVTGAFESTVLFVTSGITAVLLLIWNLRRKALTDEITGW